MCWCGVDAVVLQWEGLLLLVGPYGEHQRRPWEGPVVLVPEVDGVRLISSASHHLLRRVQDCWVQVRGGGGQRHWGGGGGGLGTRGRGRGMQPDGLTWAS